MHRPSYREEISGYGFDIEVLPAVTTDAVQTYQHKAPFNGMILGDFSSRQYAAPLTSLAANRCFFVGSQVAGPSTKMLYHVQVTAITKSENLILEPCVGYYNNSEGEARGIYRPDYLCQKQANGYVSSFKGTLRPDNVYQGNLVIGAYIETTAIVTDLVRVYVTVNRYNQPDLVDIAQ